MSNKRLVAFCQDVGAVLLDGLHHMTRQVRRVSEGHWSLENVGVQPGVGHSFPPCLSVGLDEPADPQFDPSEIADDGNQTPVQVMGPQHSVDGGPCAASRLAIVGCAVSVRAELPGVAYVSGCMVLLADFFEVCVHGDFGRFLVVEGQWKGIAMELAAPAL